MPPVVDSLTCSVTTCTGRNADVLWSARSNFLRYQENEGSLAPSAWQKAHYAANAPAPVAGAALAPELAPPVAWFTLFRPCPDRSMG